jgi:sulfate transport system substrate-binding protein
MNKTIKAAVAATATGVLALTATACGGSSSGDEGDTLNLVGYSVLQKADAGVIDAFKDTSAGKNVEIKGSYGASGDQSRAVEAGQKADIVHFSIEPDMTRLVKSGQVAEDWNTGPTKGICADSIVVFVVRPGNPKDIHSWSDLTKDGVSVVTPDPGSSGSAKWNLLAAYGSVLAGGGSDADAQSYISDLVANVATFPGSGRDATTAFTSGTGDVLLSYENEAIQAIQGGADFEYVIPDSSLLIETPCAATKDAPKAAQDFIDFTESKEGQKLYAETGFRPLVDVGDVEVKGATDPSNPFPDPATLQTMADTFNGWGEANDKYFGDGTEGKPLGIITSIINDSGKTSS